MVPNSHQLQTAVISDDAHKAMSQRWRRNMVQLWVVIPPPLPGERPAA